MNRLLRLALTAALLGGGGPCAAAIHGSASNAGVQYSQGMGATDANGFVAAIPFGAFNTTATSSWNTSSASIPFSSIPASVSVGMAVFDTTNATANGYVGQIASIVGNLVTLVALPAHASTGSSDAVSFLASSSSTVPIQQWVDQANGSDLPIASGGYNGMSPYPGFQMNGTGPNFQFGATGRGASNPNYGPKATFFTAYEAIPHPSFTNRVGNQIFVAQGGSYNEGDVNFVATFNGTTTMNVTLVINGVISPGAVLNSAGTLACTGLTGSPTVQPYLTAGSTGVGNTGSYILSVAEPNLGSVPCFIQTTDQLLPSRSGYSALYPFAFQSYDNTGVTTGATNALNTATQGRATGAGRPLMATGVPVGQFTGTIAGNVLTVVGSGPRTIWIGQTVSDSGGLVAAGTVIQAQNSGTALGDGQYLVNNAQSIGPIAMTSTGVGGPYGIFHMQDVSTNFVGTTNPWGFFVFRGFNFNSGTSNNVSMSWAANPYGVLWENNVFQGVGVGIGGQLTLDHSLIGFNGIIRHNAIIAPYSSSGGHPACLGASSFNQFYVEDNVLWNCGYPLGSPRQDANFSGTTSGNALTVTSSVTGLGIAVGQFLNTPAGTRTIISGSGTAWNFNGATMSNPSPVIMMTNDANSPTEFDQAMYLSHGGTDADTVRRNVVADPSLSCLSGREGITGYNNIFIDCPDVGVTGGSVNKGNQTTAVFNSATITGGGTTLNVTGLTAGNIWSEHHLVYVGMTGTPAIINETPRVPGGNGSYTLDTAQTNPIPTVWTASCGCSYNNASGLVTIGTGANPPTWIGTASIVVSGITGTGVNLASLNGTFTATSTTTAANFGGSISYNAGAGLGTDITITGATFDANPNLNVQMQSNGYYAETPQGVTFNMFDNFAIGGAGINNYTGNFTAQGFGGVNGLPGSQINNNLFVDGIQYQNPLTSITTFMTMAPDYNVPVYAALAGNAEYNWFPSLLNQIGNVFPAQINATIGTNNVQFWTLACGTCNYNPANGQITVTTSTPVTFGSTGVVSFSQATQTGGNPINPNTTQPGTTPAAVQYPVISASGNTVIFQAPVGLAASTITAGSFGWSPYTEAQVFQQLCTSLSFSPCTKAGLMAAAVAAPEQHWANEILQVVGPMFSFAFPIQ